MRSKLVTVFLLPVMIFCLVLTSCGKYNSSYMAIMLVTSNTSKEASMSFSSFKGTKVFKVKCKEEGEKLEYSGHLDKGEMSVYYDDDGTKKLLFTVKDGEQVEDASEELSKGTVYIIVETEGKCSDGKFEFSVEQVASDRSPSREE